MLGKVIFKMNVSSSPLAEARSLPDLAGVFFLCFFTEKLFFEKKKLNLIDCVYPIDVSNVFKLNQKGISIFGSK